MPKTRPVALLTDFGLADPFVGQMKGVLAKLAPKSRLLDVSHGIAPFNVGQAGFFLRASAPHFPADTVFVAVVDPGVGTERRIVLARLGAQLFLAPDNGLLWLVLATEQPRPAEVFDVSRAALDNAGPGVSSVSATFHGRDLFAPLAARLALGAKPESLGTALPVQVLVREDWFSPQPFVPNPRSGAVEAHVLHVDRFGNCTLTLEAGSAPTRTLAGLALSSPVAAPLRLVRTYGDLAEGELGLLAGSQGFLELAVNLGSAAERLGLGLGRKVVFSLGQERA